jgi:hypothetical protein
MGQGLYDALGWGILHPPQPAEDDQRDNVYFALDAVHAQVHTAYECEPDYLVILLAVSDAVLQNWWRLPALPEGTPRIAPRRAQYVPAPLAPAIKTLLAPQRRTLAQAWKHTHHLYQARGLALPRPALIVLSDWH